MPLSKHFEIAKGILMPSIGVGTWEMRDETVLYNVIDTALAIGYRFIDTARVYGNEAFIGKSLKLLLPKYNLDRRDIFITSKLPTSHQGTEKAQQALETSLKDLQVDYIDLYLIHFPGAQKVSPTDHETLHRLRKESWQVLEQYQKSGKLRAIGVSNYMVPHLKQMLQYANITPAVNQCEFHPHNICQDVVDYCSQNAIHFQAYSSLGSAHCSKVLLENELINSLSRKKYKCLPSQLLLAWALNQKISVLPKTTNVEHVLENFEARNLILDQSDIIEINSLDEKRHYCWDPTAVA